MVLARALLLLYHVYLHVLCRTISLSSVRGRTPGKRDRESHIHLLRNARQLYTSKPLSGACVGPLLPQCYQAVLTLQCTCMSCPASPGNPGTGKVCQTSGIWVCRFRRGLLDPVCRRNEHLAHHTTTPTLNGTPRSGHASPAHLRLPCDFGRPLGSYQSPKAAHARNRRWISC